MKSTGIILVLSLNILNIENRMLPLEYLSSTTNGYDVIRTEEKDESPDQKVMGLKAPLDDDAFELHAMSDNENTKEPCAIVVLSNAQNSNMQSLLRKYRYDKNGMLIPSSVKYFLKLPQGLSSSPILMPLNGKAFSPLGGFVRYYKAVPPIPQSW